MKRIRPAPMGRAFRVVKRTAHLTVRVAERPVKIIAAAPQAKASKAPRAKAKATESGAAKSRQAKAKKKA